MFLGHVEDAGPWSPRDRELAKALLLHEASLCHDCGQPLHESTEPDREGWYVAEPVICAGCLAMTQAPHEPGAHYRVYLDPKYQKRN